MMATLMLQLTPGSPRATAALPIGPLVPVMPAENPKRTSGCLRPSPFRDEDDVYAEYISSGYSHPTKDASFKQVPGAGSMEANHNLLAMPLSEGKIGENNIGSEKIRSDHGGRSKRRFSDEQVRSLECMFEAETMLEPRKKAQLAEKLGLQARQVAVWFQNRRARWKSKQLEREYGALQADHDALLSSFESLKREKQSLAAQLQRLTEFLEMEEESSNKGSSGGGNSERKEERDPSSRFPMEGPVEREQMGFAEVLIGCSTAGLQQEAGLRASERIISGPAEGECCFDAPGSLSGQSRGTSTDWWELWPLN
ncbi:hypothetical protein Taro_042631 [Colocasia esculenta]|uniref:Homeobox-leucine zipper protein n=1 Tax=Colocasia esculenta TaxID=4460 RepID=A0A843WEF4_COLES|nr:hypothetical protein [Colocasia esculenta]